MEFCSSAREAASMAIQRHLVVVPTDGTGVALFPLKQWLRGHPTEVPAGLSPDDSTSHALRRALVKAGWTMEETPTEVRLIKPGLAAVAAGLLEEASELDEGEEHSFALEAHLRDFLAENMASMSVNGQKLQLYADPNQKKGWSTKLGSAASTCSPSTGPARFTC